MPASESKIHLWISESCCPAPLVPTSTPLPNQFKAGTVIDLGKGFVIQQSMSVSAEGGRLETESQQH